MGDSVLLALFTPASRANSDLERLHRVSISLQDRRSFEKSVGGTSNSVYPNVAGAELSSLFMPYQSFSNVAPSGSMPMLPSGVISDSITCVDLLPFRTETSGTRTDRYASGTMQIPDTMNASISSSGYLGDIDRFRDFQQVRGIGLRGPLILTGWGFDTQGEPVPRGSGDLFKGDVEFGWQTDPKDYISAPIDLRYDNDKNLWVGGGGGMVKHQHIQNSDKDGGWAVAGFFYDSLAEASGSAMLELAPVLGALY